MKSQCLGIKWFRAIVDTFSEDNTAAVDQDNFSCQSSKLKIRNVANNYEK